MQIRRHKLVITSLLILWHIALAAHGLDQPLSPDEQRQQPKVCVVVRTYWGHGGNATAQQEQGLRGLLRSLRRQTNQNWEAMLVVLDSEPFGDMHHIVQDFNDDRIWVFAEWIGKPYLPKQQGLWTAGYHEKLYNLTDDAIRACPADTEWVVVTNGDNDYAHTFMSRVAAVQDADLVAFDFYSRYHRSTASRCERFSQQPGAPSCKRNQLKWCQTDLGANVMRWPKLMAEDVRFGSLNALNSGLAAEHFDGLMAQVLSEKWTTHHVHECLYDHSPTPQRCARAGGIWDDSDTGVADIGGRCLNAWQASKRLKDGRGAIEEVLVQLNHDSRISGFADNGGVVSTSMRCLRHTNVTEQRYGSMMYFGTPCSDDIDLATFEDPAYKEIAAEMQKRLQEQTAAATLQAQLAAEAQAKPPPPPKLGVPRATPASFRQKMDGPSVH